MYLGIDWGEKNIGLALADKENKVATPIKTINNKGNTIKKIRKICKEKNVEKIVLGVPKSFDGEKHETAQRVKQFADKLKGKLDLPLEFENEIFSSKIAKHFSEEKVDKRAATIILQSYLDKLNN